jgi:hypothetical protein
VSDRPDHVVVFFCACCGGHGTAPAMIHMGRGCDAVASWHGWHDRYPTPEARAAAQAADPEPTIPVTAWKYLATDVEMVPA